MAAMARGLDTPSERKTSEEDEEEDKEEGEVTLPPHSLSCKALPSLDDIFLRQMRVTGGAHQLKQTQTETGLSTDSPPQPCLMLVSPDSWGVSVVPAWKETTHLFGVL
jgi:hypothetical protein